MIQNATLWWCRLLGYADCHAMSTVEAILLGIPTLLVGWIALVAATCILMVIVTEITR